MEEKNEDEREEVLEAIFIYFPLQSVECYRSMRWRLMEMEAESGPNRVVSLGIFHSLGSCGAAMLCNLIYGSLCTSAQQVSDMRLDPVISSKTSKSPFTVMIIHLICVKLQLTYQYSM